MPSYQERQPFEFLANLFRREQGSNWQIEISAGIKPSDLAYVLAWSADPETRLHLSPAPDIPNDWDDPEQLNSALQKLQDYYNNFGEPEKILPLVARRSGGVPVGVVTVRWKGDPWAPDGSRIASIERLIVNPYDDNRNKGVATKLIDKAIRTAFLENHYKNDTPAKQIRAWVMTETENRTPIDHERNLHLFIGKFGFRPHGGERGRYENPSWNDYLEKRNIPVDNRGKALWVVLNRDDWLYGEWQKTLQRKRKKV